jgi:V/A-type H+-transporting ATPase subunit E
MALVDLLAGLEAEAAVETARLEAETREEVDSILEEARAEARELHDRTLWSAEEEDRREANRLRSAARLTAAAALRDAHEEAFREFLSALRSRLDALRESADYSRVLGALIRESVAALPRATVLRVDPRDERLVESLLTEFDAELEVAAALETVGGVELADAEDRVARNTIEERLANAESALRLLFAGWLRGDGR